MKRFFLTTGFLAAWATFSAPSGIADELVIDQPPFNDKHPVVAANTNNGEYLAVYASGGYIKAARLNGLGESLDNTKYVGLYSQNSTGTSEAAVAYNPSRNEYLVVWEVSNADDAIKGILLNGNGDAVGSEFVIMANASSPSVAYSPTSGMYLVVADLGGESSIDGRLVRWDGLVYNRQLFIASWSWYKRANPSIVYNSLANEFFVVWEDASYSRNQRDIDIIGQRIRPYDGALLGGHIGVAQAGIRGRINSDIAYNPTYDQYAVVYEYEWSSNDHDVKAQRLSRYGEHIGGETNISSQYNWEGRPVISFNRSLNEYAIAYEYAYTTTNHDIKLQRLSSNGWRIGGSNTVTVSSQWEGEPALAYNPRRNEYLAVYEYEWSVSDHDIRGRRLSSYGYRL